jgi:ABC-type uncharacterized transport system fused permease/ATPase subunit
VLSHFTSNTEAIAALDGDSRERDIVEEQLKTAVGKNGELYFTQWWFGAFEGFIAKWVVPHTCSRDFACTLGC